MTQIRTWEDFWNGENDIYVSLSHKKAHYKAIARDILSLLPPTRPLTLLDYGCGEALATPDLIRANITVFLYDPIQYVRDQITKHFQDTEGIGVVHSTNELSKGSLDVILINSVSQYISKGNCKRLLSSLRELLTFGGELIIADVVPSQGSVFADIVSLLGNSIRYGFFFAALRGLARTFFSDYRAVRREAGFSTYTETEMRQLLQSIGFEQVRRVPNIGLTPHRMTFVAR